MLVGMNEHTCTLPQVCEVDHAEGTSTETVVISVAEVMLSTSAASSVVRPRSALRERWVRRSAARAQRARIARRRPDYFENAAMAREMFRL